MYDSRSSQGTYEIYQVSEPTQGQIQEEEPDVDSKVTRLRSLRVQTQEIE